MNPPRRHFTPEQANRMLPLVRAIVNDIVEKGAELRSYGEEGRGTSPRFQKAMDEINALKAELEDLGCFYKDWAFQVGLVDFPAQIDGEEVFLCWSSDEPAVTHYHSLEEGFANRKKIPALSLQAYYASV